MEQAFILPIPKRGRSEAACLEEEASRESSNSLRMRALLEKLKARKIEWDEFLKKVDLLDPDLRMATTKEGDTLLHLAVIEGKKEVVEALNADPILAAKRNQYGLTAKEVAQFLWCEDAIKGSPSLSFSEQPSISFDRVHKKELDHLTFLPHPIFENASDLYDILNRSQRAKQTDRIPPEKIWMGIYFDKEIQKGIYPPVEIRYIDPEVGLGVFAAARIPSCGFVGEYTGLICQRKRKHLKNKYYCVRYTTWETENRSYVIDGEETGNFTRFINHSANPNLSLQSVYWRGLPRMIFIALKEISEGTQLTFDYGNFFWKECQRTPKLF